MFILSGLMVVGFLLFRWFGFGLVLLERVFWFFGSLGGKIELDFGGVLVLRSFIYLMSFCFYFYF